MSFLIRFVRQWIAGETLESAIERAKRANNEGIGAIINYLGEHVTRQPEAEANLEENLKILERIEGLNASLSIKPTQLGLDIEKTLFSSILKKIVANAFEKNIFVWIDMEDSPYTRDTIDVYLVILKEYRNAGIAIQANLKRSEGDVKRIAAAGGIVRLVKGAYSEKKEIAYTSREDTSVNFSKLMGYLFYKSPYIVLATHDDKLIKEAIDVNKAHGKKIEFQMLMGVREKLKRDLAGDGYDVVDYIPYGKSWFPYFLRRVRERKSNIVLILRSVLDI